MSNEELEKLIEDFENGMLKRIGKHSLEKWNASLVASNVQTIDSLKSNFLH
jgi:hypothetical protein